MENAILVIMVVSLIVMVVVGLAMFRGSTAKTAESTKSESAPLPHVPTLDEMVKEKTDCETAHRAAASAIRAELDELAKKLTEKSA